MNVKQERTKFGIMIALSTIILLGAMYLPLWDQGAPIKALFNYQSCTSADGFCDHYFPAPLAGLTKSLFDMEENPTIIFSVLFALLAIFLYVSIIKKRSIGDNDFFKYSIIILSLFFLMVPNWIFPTYLTPLLFLLIAWQAKGKKQAAAWSLGLSLLMALMYVHIH